MTAVGGSVESINLDGRLFSIAADADITVKLGGSENDVLANGDGTGRLIKTRVPFGLDGAPVVIDDSRGDHEFLQALANRREFFPINATFASGAVWQGTGQITGELSRSTQNATATVNVMGTGTLTQQ